MPDRVTPEKRSEVMRAVRSTGTELERRVRSALWRRGLRFRKNVKSLPGRPDIAFTRCRLAVFIDSCFWHGCPEHLRRPATNTDYWQPKIARNIRRDAEVNEQLAALGWTVLRIWEHELKPDFEACVERIANTVRGEETL
jgi:DNA mismatch endonuclease, patch repair protein